MPILNQKSVPLTSLESSESPIGKEADEAVISTIKKNDLLKKHEGAEYKNIVDALSEQEKRELILKRLRREVEALIERNKHIDELADILQDAVNQLKTA